MSRAEQLAEKFKSCRGPFPYKELVRLLGNLGYEEKSTGGGSRRRFIHGDSGHVIRLHEPHPGNEIKRYMVQQIQEQLEDQGLI